mmetsp:Transcript_29169/g.78923  ORF Transcript_29169/g.78923 Transcript_29169/m.78923 type:complete len:1470 (+) Transcript_29169:109-4518(+)|eukprot:CAMPEP_0172372512 /NCGR_PEP_ID=MMETSP1060-20121228/47968_1 /TAXON_ID=37318 /ORGANISM="Pseudo-nitzschia pungens, Strain cf. cingulata" /LENGTH=1469 /DNA_ID=CAMNT_0013098545 /DNA_START=18 /DNA_END=4427 /DNA_ORIENTATION=-
MTEEGEGAALDASMSAVPAATADAKNVENEKEYASRSTAHDDSISPSISTENAITSDNNNSAGDGDGDEKKTESDSVSNANGSDSGDESDGESSRDDNDSDDGNDGISAYERLRIERIRRNQERLAQLGLVDHKKKITKRKMKKQRKEIDVPTRSQPKRSAKRKLSNVESLGGGKDVLRRIQPSERSSNKHGFASSRDQKAKEKVMHSKRYRCGECRACTRVDDCQTCCYCITNQRMDSGKLVAMKARRRCLFKYCVRRLVDVDLKTANETSIEQSRSEKKVMEVKTENLSTTEFVASSSSVDAHTISSSHARAIDCGHLQTKMGASDPVPEEERNAIMTDKNEAIGMEGGQNQSHSLIPDVSSDPAIQPFSAHDKDENKSDSQGDSAKACDRTPIDYLQTYLEEEKKESGKPKWLDEFQAFLATVPHGTINRVPGKKNIDSTMSQVCKLVSGEGITYHLWPEGTHFKKGVKIKLGMDIDALYKEAVEMENKYEDRWKGSLLRHPINKLMCYKKWLANGKPNATTPPSSSLIAATTTSTNNRLLDDVTGYDATGEEERVKKVAKRVEDLIKPNRIKWPSVDKEGMEHMNSTSDKPDLALSNGAAKSAKCSLINSQENNQEIIEAVHCDDKRTKFDAKNAVGADIVSAINVKKYSTLSEEGKKSLAKDDGRDSLQKIDSPATNTTCTLKDRFHEGIEEAATVTTIKKEATADLTKTMPESCCICSQDDFLICCDGCGRGYHSNCHLPKIKEIPIGDWLCKECNSARKLSSAKHKNVPPKRKVVGKKKLFEGEHDDDCYMCYEGGDLICCDFCEKSFHCACHIPPLFCVPEGIWKCCECSALERKRMSRCGECIACVRDDCGKCKHCLDKPKFGGPYKLKQVCFHRVCPYPRLAPPTVRTSSTGTTKAEASMKGHTPITAKKRGRPRKSTDNITLSTDRGKKRGRPRKIMDGDSLSAERAAILSTSATTPRKSVDTPNSVTVKKRGRPRKSAEAPNAEIVKKRGRPRKSVDIENRSEGNNEFDAKCAKTEPREEEMVFRFKISSFKSAYRDPDSIKIFRILKDPMRDPSDYKTVDRACELLRKCAKSVESVKKIVLFGGVEIICNAMRDFPDRYIIQAEACCTLAELLWIYPAISRKLIHMGAIDLIVAAILNCKNYSKVQQMGSGALCAFSYDPNCIQYIIDADGLHAVISAMKRFPKKLAVQKEGCYFLQNLVVRSADTYIAVSDSQVFPIIVEAMSLVEADSEFLQSAYGLIANLALNKHLKASIGKSDCISAAISKLKIARDVEVKQAACTALRNLAMDSIYNQTKISKEGGLDVIFEAIRSSPDVPALLIASFNLMKELCINNEEVAHQVAQHNRIKIILKAMEDKSDLSGIQIAVCELIGFLVLKGQNEILAPKLAKAVLTSMKNHSENNDVQIQACDALFELSQVPTTHLILKKKETQDLLFRAKNNFKGCESDVDDIIAASKN